MKDEKSIVSEGQPKTHSIACRVSNQTYDRMKAISEMKNIPMSIIMRHIIAQYVNEYYPI